MVVVCDLAEGRANAIVSWFGGGYPATRPGHLLVAWTSDPILCCRCPAKAPEGRLALGSDSPVRCL